MLSSGHAHALAASTLRRRSQPKRSSVRKLPLTCAYAHISRRTMHPTLTHPPPIHTTAPLLAYCSLVGLPQRPSIPSAIRRHAKPSLPPAAHPTARLASYESLCRSPAQTHLRDTHTRTLACQGATAAPAWPPWKSRNSFVITAPVAQQREKSQGRSLRGEARLLSGPSRAWQDEARRGLVLPSE